MLILKWSLTKLIVEWIYLALVRLLQRALLKAVIGSSCPHKIRGLSYTAELVFVASHEAPWSLFVVSFVYYMASTE
jgi:uncharacterized MnhB-related membrane protein